MTYYSSNFEQFEFYNNLHSDINNSSYYNNTTNTLTDSQNKLVEKFNNAFLEAQNNCNNVENNCCAEQNVLDNFTNIFCNTDVNIAEENCGDSLPEVEIEDQFDNNFLLDILLSNSPRTTLDSESSIESNFDQQTRTESNLASSELYKNYGIVYETNSTTINTDNVFYIPPNIQSSSSIKNEEESSNFDEYFDLSELEDIYENLSNHSFDLNSITNEIYETETDNNSVTNENSSKKFSELGNFIRFSTAENITLFNSVSFNLKQIYGFFLCNVKEF